MESLTSIQTLLDPAEPLITLLSNAAAFVFTQLERINWAGFYLYDGDKLILGPFGGRPACTLIPMGKGVCGMAANERRIIRVGDVDRFPGHIACDDRSRSEIVLPLITSTANDRSAERLIGVLDIDSPILNRFTEEDEIAVTHFRDIIVSKIEEVLERLGNPATLWI